MKITGISKDLRNLAKRAVQMGPPEDINEWAKRLAKDSIEAEERETNESKSR